MDPLTTAQIALLASAEVVMGNPLGLMLLLSTLASAAGQGISAGTTESANKKQAMGFARQRGGFMPILNRLRNPDFGALDQRAIKEMSRASDQIGSNRAAEGMSDAGRGGTDDLMSGTIGDIVAQLATAKMQQEFQNQQLMAEIMSGDAFAAPDPESFNPLLAGALGAVGGGAAGLGQGLGTLMGTEAGLGMLGQMGETPTPGPDPQFGVKRGSSLSFPRTNQALGSRGNTSFGVRAPSLRGLGG